MSYRVNLLKCSDSGMEEDLYRDMRVENESLNINSSFDTNHQLRALSLIRSPKYRDTRDDGN